MNLSPIILLSLLCSVYIFILGLIILKLRNNLLSMKLIRGNILLSISCSTVIVICFNLIGWFSSPIVGIAVLITTSFIYANIFYPIIYPSEEKEMSRKKEILSQVWLSSAFIVLFGILYLVFRNEAQFIIQ